ncbi:MAG: hypothetical protein EZS28_054188 [Streblomastix strix]|uniref:Uncharacterized protein n=1 Tax=Streblomastix strix TaxID=222440 RepID=A0A5J4QTM6_9EUKA|nr:MAG: hypothetical protein EZS28_054188 [Streblomastix strix]
MRREVAIAPKDAKEVLKTGGGATLLYGSESKKKVEEVLKHSKLIANQESTGTTTANKSEATQQTQQQAQAVQPVQQQQKFTGFRANGNGKGWNNRFFQQPATFANWGMNQPSTWGNTQLGFSGPYNQSWTGLGQQSQATEAISADVKHAKVPETEFRQQPCTDAAAAAMRREEWGKGACGS